MSKLWGGRFQKETDELTDLFNASISFDQKMAEEDILGSIAHATMLGKQGIINQEEADNIVSGLKSILDDFKADRINFSEEFEDIHMNIEQILTDRIGSDGKKLHTGRSRNDQVATDFRLYIASKSEEIITDLTRLLKLLVDKAKEELNTLMPGYTHLQIAQPITYGHYLLCYYQMFSRDLIRFNRVKSDTLSELPLGAGALAGTTYPIDRDYVAELLGFSGIKENSIDAVSDRDFTLDFLEACAVTMMHLSRFCEEIIIYNSSEFNFITLDDAFTTGSSIMPQKKNPDLAELIRGKTGRVYGNLVSMLTTMKGLPLAYNKDLQEDKEPVIDSYQTVNQSLKVFYEMLKTSKVNKDKLKQAMQKGFINATDLADYLVKNGLPFRDAHEVIGKLVLYSEENNKSLNDLTLEELQRYSPLFKEDCFKTIELEEMVKSRKIPGGPAPEQNNKLIEKYLDQLENE